MKGRKLTARERARDYLGTYGLGLDLWALGLLGLFFLLNMLSWCVVPFGYLLEGQNAGMGIAGYVLEAVAGLVLVFVRRKDARKNPDFGSLFFLLFCLFTFLGAVAWGFYLFDYVNWAVLLFIAVFPAAAHTAYAILRRNWFALVPTAVSFALFLTVSIHCIVAL